MRIDLSQQAYRKLMTYVSATEMEVSGFASVSVWRQTPEGVVPFKMRPFKKLPEEKPYGIIFLIEDVWILDEGSRALTTIETETIASFLQDRMQEGRDLGTIKCWWHRHPLSSGWSSIDEQAIWFTPMGTTDPNQVKWSVSIVWCSDTGWNARYNNLSDPQFAIHIPLTVNGEPQTLEVQAQSEYRKVASSHTGTTKWPAKWSNESYTYTPTTWEYDDPTAWEDWASNWASNDYTRAPQQDYDELFTTIWEAFHEDLLLSINDEVLEDHQVPMIEDLFTELSEIPQKFFTDFELRHIARKVSFMHHCQFDWIYELLDRHWGVLT